MVAAKGFVCPACAQRLEVITTLNVLRNVVVRYRECRDCGHRTRTEERVRGRDAATPESRAAAAIPAA
jgi:Zn ribbon nucleic-acid-binding protein